MSGNADTAKLTTPFGRGRAQTVSGVLSTPASHRPSLSASGILPPTSSYLTSPRPTVFIDTAVATAVAPSTPHGPTPFHTPSAGPASVFDADLAGRGTSVFGSQFGSPIVTPPTSITSNPPRAWSTMSLATPIPTQASDQSFEVPITDTRPQPIPPPQPPRGSWIKQIENDLASGGGGCGGVGIEERRGRSTSLRPLGTFHTYDQAGGRYQTYVASNRPSNYDYGATGSYSHGPNEKYQRTDRTSLGAGTAPPSRLGSIYRETSPLPWQTSAISTSTGVGTSTGMLRSTTPLGAQRRSSIGGYDHLLTSPTATTSQLGSGTGPSPALYRSTTLNTNSPRSPLTPPFDPQAAKKKTVGFAAGTPPKPITWDHHPGKTTIRDRYPVGGPPRPLVFPSQDPRYSVQTKSDGRPASPAAHQRERERLRAQDEQDTERRSSIARVANWKTSVTPGRAPSPAFGMRPPSPTGSQIRSASPLGVRSASPRGFRAPSPAPVMTGGGRSSSPAGYFRTSSPTGRHATGTSVSPAAVVGSSSSGGVRSPQSLRLGSRLIGTTQAAHDARLARDLAVQVEKNKRTLMGEKEKK